MRSNGRAFQPARREARTRRAGSALSGTSPDLDLDQQKMIDHVRAAIGIDLGTGVTSGSRGEQPIYHLHGVIKNNESEDPTQHH
jgi:hypothetical protein